MQPLGKSNRVLRALLLKTGQTTSYFPGDDGALEIGVEKRYEVLTLGQYSGVTNITLNGKTDIHSNNCVRDLNTGLMVSRVLSASVGPNSNGTLPWTTNGSGEGLFTYVAAANLALLSGYADWRPPSDIELLSLRKMEAPSALPDIVAFPIFTLSTIWTYTTEPDNIVNAMRGVFSTGSLLIGVKTNALLCLLVRGPQ